jgi:hypothetical protein
MNLKPETLPLLRTPVPGRRREELRIIKLGKTEGPVAEKASITDDDVVERCFFLVNFIYYNN